jgi:gliding motility-associated-like protein
MNNTPRPMAPFQYEWNFGNGNTFTGANPPDEVYQANPTFTDTTYYVRLKVFNQCDTVILLDSVIVKAPPRAQFAPSQTNACSNNRIVFTNTSRGIGNTYQWNFGDGSPIRNINNNDTVSHVFNTGVDTVFKVVLIATNECGVDVDTVSLRVTPSYIDLAWFVIFNTQFGCVPHQVVLQNVSTGATRFEWDYGDGFTETTRDNNDTLYHTYNSHGTFTIQVRASNACTDTSGTLQVKSLQTPVVNFEIVNDYACPGTPVSFRNLTDTATTYLWNFDDPSSGLNNTSPAVNPTHIFLEPGVYDVSLQASLTDLSGVICPASVTKTVHVVAPELRIIPDSPACIRDTVRFTAVVNTPTGLSRIRDTIWKINGVPYPIPTTTYPQFSHVFTQPGNYTITLIVGTETNCYDTTSVTITVNGIPSITAINDQRICLGGSVQLSANSSVGNYQWDPSPNSGLSCYTCSNPVASPTLTTEYIVSTVNVAGCRNRDTVLVTVIQPFTMTLQPQVDTICIGDTIRLIANGASTYIWTPASTLSCSTCFNPVASPRSTTVYEVVGKDDYNCFSSSLSATIVVGEYPTITMPPSQVLATGTNYTIVPVITNGPIVKYDWTPSVNLDCDTCANPIASVRKDVCYELIATNQFQCADTATFCIRAFCENSQVFIPNTFTPTASTNNIFRVRGTGIKTIKTFRIFNRWGEMVYERTNIAPNGEGWNGRVRGVMASSDVYIYTAEVLCENDVPFTYKGNVTLIR